MVVRTSPRWEEPIRRALQEVNRIVKPGGAIVLVETLGTMREEPYAPEQFAVFFDYLEQRLGYRRTAIRTDYRFARCPKPWS